MAALEESGFVVLPGPFPVEQLGAVADAYDAEVGAAVGDDIHVGSTSTRVVDFVNRGPLFNPLYVYPPLLDAAALTVGLTFKLSSLHARTLRPGSTVLDIHVDVEHDSTGWPLLGFIFMVDAFTPDNGATRFIPGSHRWATLLGTLGCRRHRAVGVGMRAGRVTSRVQWVDMARPGCPRLQPATSVAAGRVHSARWSGRYRLLRTDESRDPRATWYRRASGAGTPRLVLPRTGSLCRRTIDAHRAVVAACTIATDCCWWSCGSQLGKLPVNADLAIYLFW